MMAKEALPCGACGTSTTRREEINLGLGDTAVIVVCEDCGFG